MAHALPLTKLAGLLVKTLSKPVAKRIKHEFSRFPTTQKILIGIGQTTHKATSRLTIWSAGYKVRSITPLDTEKAMAKGADFIGESIVFLVGGSVVVWEYNQSKMKEKKKEEKRLREMQDESDALQDKLNALDARLDAIEEALKNKTLLLGPKYVEPKEKAVPIDDRGRKGRARTLEKSVKRLEETKSLDHSNDPVRTEEVDVVVVNVDNAQTVKDEPKQNKSQSQGYGIWGWLRWFRRGGNNP